MNKCLKQLGAPVNLIQVLSSPSTEMTQSLMRSVDLIIATGGSKMVKAAYSSGKPAHGVGPGNVQVILDKGIDYRIAARQIIAGRKFDNGIICSGEQFVHLPKEQELEILSAFTEEGAHLIEDHNEIARLKDTLFPEGGLNKTMIGQSIETITQAASIDINLNTKVLLVRASMDQGDPFRREKLFPVLAFEPYQSLDEAIDHANLNLNIEGKGHTSVIHSNRVSMIEQTSMKLVTSRIVVNQTSALSAGGSFLNGFAPSTTLGCGSWGNNSLSENLDFHHLINVQRIGMPLKTRIPSPEEIWSFGD